ncbi:MAG: O-antigen ligase family protein [Candidatus Omnitrophica bacterium]|nr:O-antigen ligase family protein [Candidatus Omnitrophota bacterium]
MWLRIQRWVSFLSPLFLMASVGVTLFTVDLHTLQPFRDVKESLLLYGGALCALLLSLSLIVSPAARRSLFWLIPLLPIFAIGGWRWFESTGGSFHSAGGFGAESSFILRIYSFGGAALVLFLLAASLNLDVRKARFLTFSLGLFALVQCLGVSVEILGHWLGHEWHPFLGSASIQPGGGELKTTYFGSLGNTNFLAGILAMLFFPSIAIRFPRRGSLLNGLRWLAPVLILAIILACSSKGALLGLLIGGGVYLIANRLGQSTSKASDEKKETGSGFRHRGLALAILIVVVGLGVFILEGRRRDWGSTLALRGESVSKRLFLAYTGLHSLSDSPWIGIGPGRFRLDFLDSVGDILQSPEGMAFRSRVQNLKSFKPVHLHNDPLEMLVEWGAVGYATILVFVISAGWVGVLRMRGDPPELRGRRLGWIGGFFAGVGYSLFEFPFHLAPHLTLAAILLGLSVAPAWPFPRTVKRWSIVPLALVLIALSIGLLIQSNRLFLAARLAQAAWDSPKSSKAEVNRAYDQVNRANLLDPGNGEIGLLLGQFQWRIQQRPSDAIQTLRQAAQISDDPLVSILQGQIALDESRTQDALRAIAPLEGIADYLPGIGYIQGQIAQSLGNTEQAAEAYLRDIRATSRFPNPEQISPDPPGLYLKYGSVLEDLGQYLEATWQYEKFNELTTERGSSIPIGYLRLGRIYRDRFSDYESARLYFEKALESAEKHASAVDIRMVKEEIRALNQLVRQVREQFNLEAPPAPGSSSAEK